MQISELFVAAKAPAPYVCEDVVVTAELVAVIDGATDKSGLRFDTGTGPVAGGRFVATVIAEVLEGTPAGLAPRVVIDRVSAAVDAAVAAQHPGLAPALRPCASVVVYDPVLSLVWRVGDCVARIGDVCHVDAKAVDVAASMFRAAVLATYDALEPGTDPGRAAILALLERQSVLANTAGPFGFGVVNGQRVLDEHLEVFDVPAGAEVVLASDGYPDVSGSWAHAEARLAELIAVDPMCVGELRGTKGLAPGAESFDDRAWVSLTHVPAGVAHPDRVVVVDGVEAGSLRTRDSAAWMVTDAVVDEGTLEAAAEISPTLPFDDPALLVVADGDTTGVAVVDYSTVVAARSSATMRYAGAAASIVVVTSDGWVPFAVRAARAGGRNVGRLVGTIGEGATPGDVSWGRWDPWVTAARGLVEEANLDPAEVQLAELGVVVLGNNKEVHVSFVASTPLTRCELAVVMAAAEDSWERDGLVWFRVDELAAALDDDSVEWGDWGATTAALLAEYHGVDVSHTRVRIEVR